MKLVKFVSSFFQWLGLLVVIEMSGFNLMTVGAKFYRPNNVINYQFPAMWSYKTNKVTGILNFTGWILEMAKMLSWKSVLGQSFVNSASSILDQYATKNLII